MVRMPRLRLPAVGMILFAAAVGCQTAQTNPYATTVAPPATGMAGQPAPYGYNAAIPQGAAYPGGAPMPGPSYAGQAPVAPPSLPAASQPTSSSWSWAQTSNAPPAQSWQQAGTQMQQNVTQQTQDLASQWQNQANQYQQQLANQTQQYANQTQQSLNNTATQYQNQFNNQLQQSNQQLQNSVQQALPQQPVVQQSQYPPQSSTSSWWPFGDPNQFPPARATPSSAAKY